MSSKRENRAGFWLREKKINVQVSPGLGGVTVSLVRGSTGEKSGLKAGDRIVRVGDVKFEEYQWVEKETFEKTLNQANRPTLISFKTVRSGLPDPESLTAAAWEKILHFIKADPSRAKGIGKLFAEWDKDGSGSLTCEELCSALVSFGITFPKAELSSFRDSMDVNGDGTVSLDEFSLEVVAQHKLLAAAANTASKPATSKAPSAPSSRPAPGTRASNPSVGRGSGGAAAAAGSQRTLPRRSVSGESALCKGEGGGGASGAASRSIGRGAKETRSSDDAANGSRSRSGSVQLRRPHPRLLRPNEVTLSAADLEELPSGLWDPSEEEEAQQGRGSFSLAPGAHSTATSTSPSSSGGGSGSGSGGVSPPRRRRSYPFAVPPPLSDEQREQCFMFAQHATDPLASAWLKVLSFLRSGPENAHAVKLTFDSLGVAAEEEAAAAAKAAVAAAHSAPSLHHHHHLRLSFTGGSSSSSGGGGRSRLSFFSSSPGSGGSGGGSSGAVASSSSPSSSSSSSPVSSSTGAFAAKEDEERATAVRVAASTARSLAQKQGVSIHELGKALVEIGVPFTSRELPAWCRGVSAQKQHQVQQQSMNGDRHTHNRHSFTTFLNGGYHHHHDNNNNGSGSVSSGGSGRSGGGRSKSLGREGFLVGGSGGGTSSGGSGGGAGWLFITLEEFTSQVRVQRAAEKSEVAALRVWQHVVAFQDADTDVFSAFLQRIFETLDKDGDGRITGSELVDGLRIAGCSGLDHQDARACFVKHLIAHYHDLVSMRDVTVACDDLRRVTDRIPPPPLPPRRAGTSSSSPLTTAPRSPNSSSSSFASSPVSGGRKKKTTGSGGTGSNGGSVSPPRSRLSGAVDTTKAEPKKSGGGAATTTRKRSPRVTQKMAMGGSEETKEEAVDDDDDDDDGDGDDNGGDDEPAVSPPPPIVTSSSSPPAVVAGKAKQSSTKQKQSKEQRALAHRRATAQAEAEEAVRAMQRHNSNNSGSTSANAAGGGDAAASAADPSQSFAVGQRVAVRDDEASAWSFGTVGVAGRLGAGKLNAPKIRKDGWDKAYVWGFVRAVEAGEEEEEERASASTGFHATGCPQEEMGGSGQTVQKATGDEGGDGDEEGEEEEKEVDDGGEGHSGEEEDEEEAKLVMAKNLKASKAKILQFIQRDKGNAVALSTMFVRHENANKEQGGTVSGIALAALLTELSRLGVGFTPSEERAFTHHFDTNHDGRITLKEFTAIIAEANADARGSS